jgi:glycosyltransferase involved in cell wall biosynthesis
VHVVLDVSRLLFSFHRTSPAGIDRVEMAYARRWLDRPATECTFAAQSPWGWFATVPREPLAALVEALQTLWRDGTDSPAAAEARRVRRHVVAGVTAAMALGMGRGELRAVLARHRRPAFLLVSHRALEHPKPIAALRGAGAAFVPLIHDLIPLTHPEYARPAQVGLHARRVATTAAEADGILVNSAATAGVLARRLGGADGHGAAPPPIAVAPLGLDDGMLAATAPPPGNGGADRPYFVCLGTIEPRKNHLLLLHLWREFAAAGGPAPRLLLLGRRGWENENILDLLDRCHALRGLVEERRMPSDTEVAALLRGSRALLFPSFAEGYGLPLAEALALGAPAICSDIPALREVGGLVPDFLDPLDGAAWRQAAQDYARPDSPRRAAQLRRMRGWQMPSWERHFAILDDLLDTVVSAAPARAIGRGARRPLPSLQEPALVPQGTSLAAGATTA